MIRRVSNQFLLSYNKPDLSAYNIDNCPDKNIIYTFNHDGVSYWKIDLELLIKTKMIRHLYEWCHFCNGSTQLNKNGYVYLITDECDYIDQYRLILALIYSKNKFAFDEISHQSIFDKLTEDQKCNFESELDWISFEDCYDLDYIKFDDDVHDFICMNLDYNAPYYLISEPFEKVDDWDECFRKVDYFKKILDKKWKFIELSILKKIQYYKKQGCKIMIGNEAFDAIKKNKEYSLIAIEENEIYSVEYNRTQSCTLKTGQYIEEDYYTIRKKHNNTLLRSVEASSRLRLPFCQWAVKKYHSGYECKY